MRQTLGSRPLPSRQQIAVGVVAVLFVSDFVLCGYLPSQNRLRSLRAAEVQQQRTIQMAAAQQAELPRIERRLQEMEKTVARYQTCVPAEGTLGTFLQQIAGIMTAHHLADQVVTRGQEWTGEGVNAIPLHVTCLGTLADIFGFFQDLQSLERLVRITQVTLTNDNGFSGRASVQIEAVIFYQPPKPRPADGSVGGK